MYVKWLIKYMIQKKLSKQITKSAFSINNKYLNLISYNMEDRLDKLNDIKIENYIWVIYIFIIILSWYANSKEKNFLINQDEKSRKEYQNLLILIFTILVIIYYYFAKSSYDDIKKLKLNDTNKKKLLTYMSFLGSFLVLISGIIFLTIAINDENLDVEIAFN